MYTLHSNQNARGNAPSILELAAIIRQYEDALANLDPMAINIEDTARRNNLTLPKAARLFDEWRESFLLCEHRDSPESGTCNAIATQLLTLSRQPLNVQLLCAQHDDPSRHDAWTLPVRWQEVSPGQTLIQVLRMLQDVRRGRIESPYLSPHEATSQLLIPLQSLMVEHIERRSRKNQNHRTTSAYRADAMTPHSPSGDQQP